MAHLSRFCPSSYEKQPTQITQQKPIYNIPVHITHHRKYNNSVPKREIFCRRNLNNLISINSNCSAVNAMLHSTSHDILNGNPCSTPTALCRQRQVLTFFLANVRSLLPKIDELRTILQMNEVGLAFITKTWLNENIDDSAVEIDGFTLVGRIELLELGVEFVLTLKIRFLLIF